MSRSRPTSFEVARRARVSRTTVSLVLNRAPGARISEATRTRVLKAALALGYEPHSMGQALASRRTRNIGMAYSTRQAFDEFLQFFMAGLSEATKGRNQRLLVESYEEEDRAQTILRLTRARHIDGLVMFGPRTGNRVLDSLVREGFPLVMIGSVAVEGVCTVGIDNRAAARGIVDHLLDLGHRRIGCITNAPLSYTSSASRLQGYRDALRDRGVKPDRGLVRRGDFTADSGYLAMRGILETAGGPPTAVFVANDTVALGAMKAVREAGLRIPADVSVAGFDDLPVARFASPPLTTVAFSAVEEGLRAGEILMDLLDGKVQPGYRETIATSLVLRESTAAPGEAGRA